MINHDPLLFYCEASPFQADLEAGLINAGLSRKPRGHCFGYKVWPAHACLHDQELFWI